MTDLYHNLILWDAVSKTDPSATTRINQRGGFTAIDAYSQIRAATEQFGPVGSGWGWVVEDVQFPPNDTVVVRIALWHGDPKGSRFDVFGQKKLNGKNGPDEDAFKKALTDAITKGLSYLGFNADVFLGQFDDNKYVAKREAEVAAVNAGLSPDSIFDSLERDLKDQTFKDMDQISKLVTRYKAMLVAHDAERFKELGKLFEARQ
jgi:hypothetical protein